MDAAIRPLTPDDVHAYKALRDEALRTAPEAFTSDYESAVLRPAAEYAQRFGDLRSGTFFLGAFDASANRRSERWLRVYNEVAVLLFTAVVVLVVVKPF